MSDSSAYLGKLAPVLALMHVLSACVSAPLSSDNVTTELTPTEVLENPNSASGTVIWGGVIVSSTNLDNRTQIEVLAYPLDNFQRPVTSRKSLGRFLLQSPDYIETVDYAPGRKLTAIGTLQGLTDGEIGSAEYTYPTVTLSDVHLWKTDQNHEQPRFIFGIGIDIRN